MPHGVDNANRGRSSPSRVTRSARTSALALHRVAQNRTRADRRHARHARIVHVQHGDARRRQRRHQFALRPGHAVEITEVLDMRHGDAGDDADIRAAHVGQARDVARSPSTHLQDDPLDVVRSIEEGQREAELVVERPLAGRHTEGRRRGNLRSRSFVVVLPTEPVMPITAAVHALACDHTQTQERHGGVLDDDRRRPDGFP